MPSLLLALTNCLLLPLSKNKINPESGVVLLPDRNEKVINTDIYELFLGAAWREADALIYCEVIVLCSAMNATQSLQIKNSFKSTGLDSFLPGDLKQLIEGIFDVTIY